MARWQYDVTVYPGVPIIPSFGYFRPLEEPVRLKDNTFGSKLRNQLPTAEQPFIVDGTPFWQAIKTDPFQFRWYKQWVDPQNTVVAEKRILPTHEQQQYFYLNNTPLPSFVSQLEWTNIWVDPQFKKERLFGSVLKNQLQTSLQQGYFFPNPPPWEVITVDKYYQWLSEPVRQKPRLGAALNQDLAFLNPVTSQEFIRQLRWENIWVDPRRFPPILNPASQQFFSYGSYSPLTNIILGIINSQEGPTFTRTLSYQARTGVDFYPAVDITRNNESLWHEAWRDPVRTKPRLLESLQQAQIQGWVNPPAEVINLDKWYSHWREPVRTKPGLQASLQEFFKASLRPIIPSFGYFDALSEPVRLKPRLQPSLNQFLAFTELVPPVFIDAYLYPFSEPVRQKVGLRADLQQALAWEFEPSQLVNLQWMIPFGEPVRTRWFPASENQVVIGEIVPLFPPIAFADVIVQTWDINLDVQTWVIDGDITDCGCT